MHIHLSNSSASVPSPTLIRQRPSLLLSMRKPSRFAQFRDMKFKSETVSVMATRLSSVHLFYSLPRRANPQERWCDRKLLGACLEQCRFFVSTSASRRNSMPKMSGTGQFWNTWNHRFFRPRQLPRSLIGACTRPTEGTRFLLPNSNRLISLGALRIIKFNLLTSLHDMIFFSDPESGQAKCSCPPIRIWRTFRLLTLRGLNILSGESQGFHAVVRGF